MIFTQCCTRRIYCVVNDIEGMVNGFDFAKAIVAYYEAYYNMDDNKKSNVLRWFRGEYATKSEAKRELGINVIVTDQNWYDFLKIFSSFVVHTGYKGMLIFIDELVNLYKIPTKIARQYNYEKLLMMYNDILQGKANYIGMIMGGTPECMEDTRTGIFSYEALKSRLTSGHYADKEIKDLLAPIIYLKQLTKEEIYVLLEKLTDIHANLYSYKSRIGNDELLIFMKKEYSRIGAIENVTPRDIIRNFIEVLNILYQNPEKTMQDVIGENNYAIEDSKLEEEFIEFEV